EAIVDKVRAIEFDMESIDVAEVGSVMADIDKEAAGFERIADEDDIPAEKPKKAAKAKTGSTRKKKDADETAETEDAAKKPASKAKKPAAKNKTLTTKTRTKTKTNERSGKEPGEMPNAEASVR